MVKCAISTINAEPCFIWVWMPTMWRNWTQVLPCIWKTDRRVKLSVLWCQVQEIGTNVAAWMKCFALNFFFSFSASISAAPSDFHLSKIQFPDSNQKETVTSSSFLSSIHLLLHDQQGTLSPPLKIKLTISSAAIVLPISSATPLTSMTLGSAWLPTPPDPMSFSSLQTNIADTLSLWLLWLSPIDIKLHTVHH